MSNSNVTQEKKPLYKRWWFWLIIVILIGSIGNAGKGNRGGSSSNSNSKTTVSLTTTVASTTTTTQTTEPIKPMGAKEKIESVIRDRISSNYTLTDIDRITINDDLGTDKSDDYIALVYLTWNQFNKGETSKKVLKLYSDDLAATLANECENVQELAIFWTVPYLNNASAKCSYERKNNKMYEMDMIWESAFNQ